MTDARPLPPDVPSGVHETVLYADDLEAASAFYRDVVGLRLLVGPNATLAALRIDAGGVLLLFAPDESSVEGREVPSHGARGPGHVAFSAGESAVAAILGRAAERGIALERELTWPRGGRSVYLRDPAGNSVELIVGEIWPD